MASSKLKGYLDETLAGLTIPAGKRAALVNGITAGRKRRRKLSVGLVLTVVLLLAALTALAAVAIGWGDAALYLRRESEGERFADWAGAERTALVASLLKDGALPESDATRRLLAGNLDDAAQAALAEQILTDWLAAPAERVAFRPIMERLWGDFAHWTLEQKAWFTQTLIDAGVQQPDFEKYALPDAQALPRADAEAIARAYAELWRGMPPGSLEDHDVVSEYVIFPRRVEEGGIATYTTEGADPVWYVAIADVGPNGSACELEIDPVDGSVDHQGMIGKLLYERFGVDWRGDPATSAIADWQSEQRSLAFFDWSLAEKARWSETVRPFVWTREQEEPDFYDLSTRVFTRYRYGVPDAHALPEADARARAERLLCGTYGLTDLAAYDCVYTYYDNTNPDAPLWRFHFSMHGRRALETFGSVYRQVNYRVELNAVTGEAVTIEAYRLGDATGYEALLRWV